MHVVKSCGAAGAAGAALVNAMVLCVLASLQGATESNNIAIKGVAKFYREQKNHIITTQTVRVVRLW